MSVFEKLLSFIRMSPQKDAHLFWVYVRCDHCQEKLQIHVDLRNDLSVQYGETERQDMYFTRKRIVGSKGCFRPIEIELTFDNQRKLLEKQIQGGEFITEEEYTSSETDAPG